MKIHCDACGSKYSIADDKVRGKRVKVRCKSCQASILVDGTTMGESSGEDDAPEEEAAIAPADTSSPVKPKPTLPAGSWSVNLSDDDSRDMTTAELVTAWKKGEVTADAYVWKDGMDDWTPIQDVAELRSKLTAARPVTPAKAAAPVAAKSAPRAAAADDGVTTSAKTSKAGARARQGSMDDLFGGVDFAGKDEAPANPAPAAAVDEKPKGSRNESSVLFSLDALKAGVEAERGEDPAQKPNDDPFGLGGGGGGFGGFGGGGLGSFGGGFGGNAADLLTAPVKEPPRPVVQPTAAVAVSSAAAQSKPKSKGLLIGAVVGVLALGGAAFAFMGGGDSKTEVQGSSTEVAAKPDAAAEAEKKAMADQLAKAEAEKKAMADQLAKAEAEKKKAEEASATDAAKKDEAKPAEAAKPGEAKPGEAKPAEAKPAGAVPAKSEPKPAAPAAPSGGGSIDMAAVKAALGGASARASTCSKPGGPTGAGKVQVTFAPSGRVTNAMVTGGAFGGTAVGGCVASTFRAARVPAFSGAPVTVAKGFTIR